MPEIKGEKMNTEKERLENVVTKYQLIVNSIVFLLGDKTGGLENDALVIRLKEELKNLIRYDVLHDVSPDTREEAINVPVANIES